MYNRIFNALILILGDIVSLYIATIVAIYIYI